MEYIELEAPCLASKARLLIGGLCERYAMGKNGAIPLQWERFSRYRDTIPGGIDDGATYGVCFNFGGVNEFDYLCEIEVENAKGMPREFGHVEIPAHDYAVFMVEVNIAEIRRVYHTIWSHWLPPSGCRESNAPVVECYREDFDPLTGDGGFEIWIPIEM